MQVVDVLIIYLKVLARWYLTYPLLSLLDKYLFGEVANGKRLLIVLVHVVNVGKVVVSKGVGRIQLCAILQVVDGIGVVTQFEEGDTQVVL